MFRAIGSPFLRSFPGPRRSVLDWPWCPWSCGRPPWRSLSTLRSTSSRDASHWSVTCWAFAASGRYVIPRRSTSSSTVTCCGWRLVATLRSGDDVVTKSKVCVRYCFAAFKSWLGEFRQSRNTLRGCYAARTPVPPEGRVRSDKADNLRTVLPLFRAILVPLDLGFLTGYARVATAHNQHEQHAQSLFSSWRLSHMRQPANMLCTCAFLPTSLSHMVFCLVHMLIATGLNLGWTPWKVPMSCEVDVQTPMDSKYLKIIEQSCQI